jgi:hypothetical protein
MRYELEADLHVHFDWDRSRGNTITCAQIAFRFYGLCWAFMVVPARRAVEFIRFRFDSRGVFCGLLRAILTDEHAMNRENLEIVSSRRGAAE